MNRKKILILIIVLTSFIVSLIFYLSKTKKYSDITIDQNNWDNIKNTRKENKNLKIENIQFNDYSLIIDEKNNTIYYSLINESKNKYNPYVKFKTSNKNEKVVILEDVITDEKVNSNYEFKIMIYSENEYHIYYLNCTNFPMLNISYENINKKQSDIKMEMYLFNNLTNMSRERVVLSDGEFNIRESKILLSLYLITPGNNFRENVISIFNMQPSSEYILNKANSEQDNENLSNEKTKQNIVELFLNGEHMGRYSLNVRPGIN